MGFIDKQALLSEDQAITGSAASTNLIDLGAESSLVMDNPEYNVKIVVQVTTDFATLTSLAIALQCDTAATFGSATSLESKSVLLAGLTAGKQFVFHVPRGVERYIRMYYTVTGDDATAGKVHAAVVLDQQSNGAA